MASFAGTRGANAVSKVDMRCALVAVIAVAGCGDRGVAVVPWPRLVRDTEVVAEHLRYGLHLAPQPNLVYQLDCISGVVICGRPSFEELWTALGRDPDDEAALATWHELRTRYGGHLERIDRPPEAAPLLVSAGVPDVAERQRIASLVTRTPDAYVAALGVLSSDADARRLGAVLERFEPRFAGWWREQGFAAGSAAFDAFARLLADPFLDGVVARAARFYGAELPDGPALDVHLIVQPRSQRHLSVAIQLERYAVVEIPAGDRPDAQIDVITHEAFHYFFSRMPPARRAALLRQIVDSPDPNAAAAFGVLDEAVAATIGNGVIGRHYTPPDRFAKRLARDDGLVNYRAASVVARALLPSMEQLLDGAGISSPEFIDAFLAAARATYDGGRPRPIDYLHSHVLVADPRFAAARQRLLDETHAWFPYLREYGALDAEARGYLIDHPFQSAAIFAASDAEAARAVDALRPGTPLPPHAARGYVYALPRTPKSYVFLFVAEQPAAIDALVTRFTALPAMSEGVLVDLSL